MKVKELHFADIEIQEAVTDEQEEFSAAVQKLYDCAKAYIYANGAYFEQKKVCVSLTCLRFFFKSVLKLLGLTVCANIKLHENPCSGNRIVACGRTERHDEANIRFCSFANAPKD